MKTREQLCHLPRPTSEFQGAVSGEGQDCMEGFKLQVVNLASCAAGDWGGV